MRLIDLTALILKTYFSVFHYRGNPDDQDPYIYELFKNNQKWPDLIFHDALHHVVKNQK